MRLLIFAILFCMAGAVNAQSYTIIHIMGKIYDTSTGKYLKTGTRLSESSQLKFESPTAKAAVLSSKRGRYIIKKGGAVSNQSDLSYALSSVLSPARGKLSTRAGGINNQLDFSKKFGEGANAWIGDFYKVAVSSTAYPVDDKRFFYVNYTYNGEGVNKRLESNGDTLIFDRSTFYAIDDKSIDASLVSNMLLFYYDAEKEESSEITAMEFALVSKEDLTGIISSLSDLDKKDKNTALHEIILSLYGNPNAADIEMALGK